MFDGLQNVLFMNTFIHHEGSKENTNVKEKEKDRHVVLVLPGSVETQLR